MKTETAVKLAIIAGAGLAAYFGLRYAGSKLTGAAGAAWDGIKDVTVKVVDAVNPASANNLAYRGTSAVVQSVTNDPYATLGTKIWEWANPDAVTAEKRALGVATPEWDGLSNEDAWIGDSMPAPADISPSFDMGYLARGVRRR